MAGSNGGEGAVEMSFDGADGEAGDGGDFGELQFFEEAKEEDAALAIGELGNALPDEGHLFGGNESGLEGAVAVRNVRGDVGDVDGRFGDPFPEAEAVGAGVVANEVEGDAHKPGGDGTVSWKVWRAAQARTKVSWVRDWARSRSRMETRWKRKMRCS